MTTKINNVNSLLITEIIKERLNQMLDDQTDPMQMIFKIKDLLAELKGQEIKNIDAAFREGYMTTDRWSLELEVFDHIKMRYDQDTMTYDEYYEAKKSAIFFRTNFEGDNNE
jgi:hypothetical protein